MKQTANVIAALMATSAAIRINPSNPTGLVSPPPDRQYDVPMQIRNGLNAENRHEEDDLRNLYNPNKGPVPIYLNQITPNVQQGLETPPHDRQYDQPW
jgi:hypothetical protein